MENHGNGDQKEATPPDGFKPLPVPWGFAELVGPLYFHETRSDAPIGCFVQEKHLNPARICHGGMLMTMMDMGVGFAIGAKAEDASFLPTMNMSYDFLAPAQLGDWLESKVDFVHTTKNTGFANGYLMSPRGIVVRANGICKIVRGEDKRFKIDDSFKESREKRLAGRHE